MSEALERKLDEVAGKLDALLERVVGMSEQLRGASTAEGEILTVLMAPLAAKMQTGEELHPKIAERLEHTSFERMLEMADQHRDRLLDLADKLDSWLTRADEALGRLPTQEEYDEEGTDE